MPRLLLRLAGLLSLLCVAPMVMAQDDSQLPATRAEFAAAYAAPTVDASGDSEALRGYVLYPWLAAARLSVGLSQTDDVEARIAAARAFLDAAGEAPHARDLRRALLARHVARGDYAGFLADWRESAATDALRCQKLDAQIATQATEGLAEQMTARWLAAETPAPECAAAYAWFKKQPAYTPALVERGLRARLLDGDVIRARELLATLPADRQPRYEAWLRQLSNPAPEFAKLAEGQPQLLDGEGLADTWMRWARKSPTEAAALLDAVAAAQKLSPAQKQTLQRNTALALAWNRDAEAVALFKQVPDELLDERGHEWRVRAALWAGDWNRVLNWLVTMPDELAAQPRWRYWNARALEALGQKAEATKRYRSLMLENDTYGLLAAWRAGKGWKPIDEPQPITAEQQAALDALPALQRAREAWRTRQKSIASLEWRAALDAVPESARSAMVREAASLGWHDQAIVTATRFGLFRDLAALFPRPYPQLVQQAAEQSGIPAPWIYGVMRKESAFKPDAVSSAGALGLLQMMPGTAAMTAKAAGQPVPEPESLKDPAVNVPLGAMHLREVLDKAEGRWQVALAAYNAGFRATTRWRPPATMDADIWIENIPFNETRGYVQRILFHTAVYQWLETEKPVRANNWLPPVEPAAAAP